MPALPRSGAGDLPAGGDARLMQTRHQIPRQERTIAGHAHEPRDLRRFARRPVEAGKNAGERAGVIRHAIGDHGEAAIGKARRIAGGIEDEPAALRSDAREDAFENGRAADADARLVAAAHPPRLPAGEDDPDRRRICRAR